ncbi:MAG: hypothetical protein FJ091_06015 [Deltaproteobacteria bacterium]|nr:hypothetical protein [Deltaproteobacteria bacterium]
MALAIGVSAAATAATTVVPLLANDLAWDAVRGVVWASVPGNGGRHANSIVAIDPTSGAFGTSIFVGSEPTELALS